jgi:hypothetical protein
MSEYIGLYKTSMNNSIKCLNEKGRLVVVGEKEFFLVIDSEKHFAEQHNDYYVELTLFANNNIVYYKSLLPLVEIEKKV